jgi:acyl carrier protein
LDLDIRAKISATLSEMVGVEPGKIVDSTNLTDLGIHSLMDMEVACEFGSVFNCALDMASMMALIEFGDLTYTYLGICR